MRSAVLFALLVPLVVPSEGLAGVTAEEGTSVTKTFLNRLELELVDVAISLDGESQELPAGSKPSVTIVDEEEVVFVDRYLKVEGGRAVEVIRSYETLVDSSSQSVVLPGQEEEVELEEIGESALLGTAVKFTWDGDAYDVEFEGDEEDEGLLEGLEGDADFLFLLSDEALEVGDSWELEPEVLDRISSPSGNLKIFPEDVDLETNAAFAEGFRDNLDGDVKARLESIEDGVATIALKGTVTTLFDVEASEDDGGDQGLEFEFVLGGKLLWDLEAGHAAELQLGGDVTMTVTVEQGFGEAVLSQVQTFEGTFESAATFE